MAMAGICKTTTIIMDRVINTKFSLLLQFSSLCIEELKDEDAIERQNSFTNMNSKAQMCRQSKSVPLLKR
jgi:hypothetical protein